MGVKQTPLELDISRSSFDERRCRYKEAGYDGLGSRHKDRPQVRNRIPE